MSSWIRPKFAYNPGTGIVDFTPVYPAIQKSPVGTLSATRHDSFTSEGDRQSVTERVDELLPLNFETVPQSDLASWKAFMSWALTGAQFTYYPDSTDPNTYTEYTLEETDWIPKWKSQGHFSFTFTMRVWVGYPAHYS